ncbi:hypothetical protein [uncultured Lactococcus sp.]|jgi:hypothetical protein|uniref:hypothetical protein n=1 Tax=uncultured Lactococcus sp. TaxID=167973 RepID=UPI0027DB9C5C|nr:hypothetical protein [uncultured Lactococcus sp.]
MKLGKYTLTAKRLKSLTVIVCDEQRGYNLARKFIYFTEKTERKPLVITKEITEKYYLKQQAKQDLKTSHNKEVGEPLFTEAFELAINNKANGCNPFWTGLELYWAGYARGVREQRQKQREKSSNIGLLTGNDIADLAQALHIDINKLNTTVLELTASKGGRQ